MIANLWKNRSALWELCNPILGALIIAGMGAFGSIIPFASVLVITVFALAFYFREDRDWRLLHATQPKFIRAAKPTRTYAILRRRHDRLFVIALFLLAECLFLIAAHATADTSVIQLMQMLWLFFATLLILLGRQLIRTFYDVM